MTTPPLKTLASAAGDCRRAVGAYGPLALIAALYCVFSFVGITWGLPSRKIDKYLFGDGEVWSGEKIHRLSNAGEKFSAEARSIVGADVDMDPLLDKPPGARPVGRQAVELSRGIPLTGTDEDIAKIYLRYRLYSYQPDEMITMMALAGMRPGEWDFDPRLYQYGGLFLYPVGSLIRLFGALGLIDVRNDLVFYLDHPDEFGKFYIVARAYSAAWGLLGFLVVFAITRRLVFEVQNSKGEDQQATFGIEVERLAPPANLAGLIAALLFTLMPVVVCMAHEGKPHLPGAVLMLLAVYLAMRGIVSNQSSTTDNRKFFWLMCIACGAATGMVLSSWPICVLIPLVVVMEWQVARGGKRNLGTNLLKPILGTLLAVGTYFAANPYVLINFFSNRDILRSNFGNSLAMYEIERIGEGFLRVMDLMVEGATLPVVILGILAVALASVRHRRIPYIWLAMIPALLFFFQFVLIGAGKPDEYGRFGIFTLSILVIGAACLLFARPMNTKLGALVGVSIAACAAMASLEYVTAFHRDSNEAGSRIVAAEMLAAKPPDLVFAVPVEPAPYCCPPLAFATRKVLLAPDAQPGGIEYLRILLDPIHQPARISWASKRFTIKTGPIWDPTFQPVPADPAR